jgi:hypothetical protein
MTDIDIGYFAGFLDGEGTINVLIDSNANVTIQVWLVNTCRAPLDRALELFGGTLKDYPAKKVNCKPMHKWWIIGRNALPFLEAVQPYLLIKREQVRLALEIVRTLRDKTEARTETPNQVKLFRVRIAQEIQKLNQGVTNVN